MFNFLKRKQPACVHEYATVAYDAAFVTIFKDRADMHHHLRWKKCRLCGDRSFDHDHAYKHTGVERVNNHWIENGVIMGTAKLEVYDEDYTLVSRPTSGFEVWKYKQLTGVEKLINQLKEDGEFKELLKNQMVKDAMDELETIIQLHTNLQDK